MNSFISLLWVKQYSEKELFCQAVKQMNQKTIIKKIANISNLEWILILSLQPNNRLIRLDANDAS